MDAAHDDIDEPVRFGEGEPYTLGVEEELFLADAGSGALINQSDEVLERMTLPERGEVKGEIHACQVELITDVCATAGEAVGLLRGLRRSEYGTLVRDDLPVAELLRRRSAAPLAA